VKPDETREPVKKSIEEEIVARVQRIVPGSKVVAAPPRDPWRRSIGRNSPSEKPTEGFFWKPKGQAWSESIHERFNELDRADLEYLIERARRVFGGAPPVDDDDENERNC
jgi:hypothetical protein